MKKALSILLALTLTFCCAVALSEEAATEDNGFVIILTGNPTTGFDWSYVADETIVTVEKEYLGSEDIDKLAGIEPAGEMLSGEGGLYVFTIKGVTPGLTVIALEYNQSWDETSTVAGLTYVLRVEDDLSVVCVSSALGI